MKVAFFDRDGTINVDYTDEEWTNKHTPELVDGALEALAAVRALGYEIIIITNQYLIDEGFITIEEYHAFSNKLLLLLEKSGITILDVFYCRHARWGNCPCMKPKAGMIKDALRKYPSIDLSRSFFIGDSRVDIELAYSLEMRGFGINVKTCPGLKNITYIESIRELPVLLEEEEHKENEP
ncbi:MAG: D-glycero-alpha-D-manno-heptose-1,7-bisphosphate 7-phosphatase [Lysinibacillus sp.]